MDPAAADPMDSVAAALFGLRSVPRRVVVLPDGSLGDKSLAPGARELSEVSVACEAIRRHRGERVLPRSTRALVRECLALNDAAAWDALLSDLATSDADPAVVGEELAASDVTLVDCLLAAAAQGPGQHFAAVLRASRAALKTLDAGTRTRTALAFERRFGDLVSAVSRRARDVNADDRATCITDLGKLMAWCRVPVSTLAAHLRGKLADDALLLFLFAPLADVFAEVPEAIPGLVTRAERATLAGKYPSCVLLALAPPDLLKPHAARVEKVVTDVLNKAASQGGLDPRLALAAAGMAQSVLEPRSLQHGLAVALKCMAAQVVRHAPTAPTPPTM